MSNGNKSYTGEEIGQHVLQAIKEMKAGKKSRAHTVALTPATIARHKTGLSQSEFANLLGISKRTLQGWEQGLKTPSGAARTLIKIANIHPEILQELQNSQSLSTY